jgi:uncharacterized membrane protein YbaN (DUF454 family)
LLTGGIYVRSYTLITQSDRDEWLPIILHFHKSNPRFNNWTEDPSWPEFKLTFNEFRPGEIIVRFPYWFALLMSATLAAVPWFRWRFSLRTLLVAMTLIAALLGLVFALGR